MVPEMPEPFRAPLRAMANQWETAMAKNEARTVISTSQESIDDTWMSRCMLTRADNVDIVERAMKAIALVRLTSRQRAAVQHALDLEFGL